MVCERREQEMGSRSKERTSWMNPGAERWGGREQEGML